MSNALDEILLKHGADKGELRFSLKQDLYQLILTEVIGEDETNIASEYMDVEHMGLPLQAIQFNNQLKQEQRQTLAKLFNQENDDE